MVKDRLAELQARSLMTGQRGNDNDDDHRHHHLNVNFRNGVDTNSISVDSDTLSSSQKSSSSTTDGGDVQAEKRPLKNGSGNRSKSSKMVNDSFVKFRQKLVGSRMTNSGDSNGPNMKKRDTLEFDVIHLHSTSSSSAITDSLSAFMERYASLANEIDMIAVNAKQMESVYRRILNSTHRVEVDEAEIERLTQANKRLGKSIQTTLKVDQTALDSQAEQSDFGERVQMENRMKSTQIAAQSRRFYATWNDYNRVKMDFRERSRRLIVQKSRITNNHLSDDQIEDMLDNGQLMAMFGADHIEQEKIARAQLDEIQSRHNELLKLEASIREMHEMFVDIAILVESQGEMIDSIERHITNAREAVDKGRQDLGKAEKLQAGARKKKIILFTVIAFIVFIVLLVIVVDFGLL